MHVGIILIKKRFNRPMNKLSFAFIDINILLNVHNLYIDV